MNLLTHNLLICPRDSCNNEYSLDLLIGPDGQIIHHKGEGRYTPTFMRKLLEKVDWGILLKIASQLGILLPDECPDHETDDENLLSIIYKALFNVHVETGTLVCPNCQTTFPVTKGIPNMLLKSDVDVS